jgi:hypothetical protein
MSSLDHIQVLSETIGPRGSATEGEAKAADYVAAQLAELGLPAERQRFLSAASSYAPYALAAALGLLSVVLLWQPQPVGAAAAVLLVGAVLGALLFELRLRPNLLRWVLPIEDSQNVVARIPRRPDPGDAPASDEDALPGRIGEGPPPQTVVVTAHLDTHRTPLVFRSPAWLSLFRLLIPLGLASLGLLLALSVIGIFVPAQELRWIALAPGAALLALLALMAQADRTPYSPGANDNASGVAAGLWLAGQLAQQPLRRTDVILVFTGCEEVGCYGADAFFAAQADGLRDAMLLVLDQVAAQGGSPLVVRSERFLARAPSDPALLASMERLAAQHPEWNARFVDLATGYGELSAGAGRGLRAIAFGSAAADGTSPHWHQPGDVAATVDAATLDRVQQMAWLLLQDIDRPA